MLREQTNQPPEHACERVGCEGTAEAQVWGRWVCPSCVSAWYALMPAWNPGPELKTVEERAAATGAWYVEATAKFLRRESVTP